MTADLAPTSPVHEAAEMCARHADALAGQAEAAERVAGRQIRQLNRGQVRLAYESAEWLRSTLRVLACSLGELHTVLDEIAAGEDGGVR